MSSSLQHNSIVRFARNLRARFITAGAVLAVVAGSLVFGASPASAAVVTPFAPDINQAIYGDYILAGNTVMNCPAGDSVCIAGQTSNASGLATTYTNDSFLMRYSDVDSDPSTFNSASVRYKVPPGATILKARLWWGGNTGEAIQLNGQNITACNGSRPNSSAVVPAVLPSVGGTPSTHAIKASVNGTSLGTLTPEHYAQDLSRTNGGRHYAASRDVTSLLASQATNVNLDLTVANIWTPTGYNCAGGFTLGIVWSYPSANATYAPKIRQVLMFDGFVAQGAKDAPTITTLNGFTIAAGVTKVGVAVLEGDQAIQGDQLLVNNVAMSDPRTTPVLTNNFFQSTVQGALNPNFPNTYGIDTKSIDVPAGLVNPGDTQVLLKFTTAGDQYFPYMFAMSAPITSTFLTGTVWSDTDRDGVIDAGEIGLPGVTVTLTKPDGSTITTTTGSDGTYRFDGLTVGNYTITETQPTGYGSSTPNAITSIAVPASGLSNQNFGDTLGSLSGTVYNDVDRGGSLNAGDTGLGGVTVYLTGSDASGRPVSATAVTAANGTYSFAGLPGGTYSVSEVQPGAFADSTDTAGTSGGTAGAAGTDLISAITLTNGAAATGYNFGETQTGISGTVYLDANNDGTKSGVAEVGIGGVTVSLSGTTSSGASVSLTTTTAADGSYSFLGLLPGTYTVTETQPTAYGDGLDTAGSAGGTATNDAITLTLGALPATAYNFGERGSTVSGSVYLDTNADGIKNGAEAALPATTVTITLKDHATGTTIATATTAADGSYSFANVPAGVYDIVETQPAAYGSTTANTIASLNVPAGANVTDQNFGEKASSIAGRVYMDTDANNAFTAGEGGVGLVTVTLKNAAGTTIATTTTASDGTYSFTGLGAGTYTVVETQPSGYTDKADTAGTSGGTVTNDTISAIALTAGTDASGYNFGEGGTIWSGTVYVDANANGTRDSGETGISGVTLALQHAENNVIVCPALTASSYYGAPYGNLCLGALGYYLPTSVTSVTWVASGTTTTNSSGAWSFSGMGMTAGYTRYRVLETQPTTYSDGTEQVGTGGATNPANDQFEIAAMPTNGLAGYNFGELGASVSGKVYEDLDNSNSQAASGEPGIAGVTVSLKNSGGTTIATTLTDANGNWSFGGLAVGWVSTTV
jgi:large repetitive protein